MFAVCEFKLAIELGLDLPNFLLELPDLLICRLEQLPSFLFPIFFTCSAAALLRRAYAAWISLKVSVASSCRCMFLSAGACRSSKGDVSQIHGSRILCRADDRTEDKRGNKGSTGGADDVHLGAISARPFGRPS